MRIFVVFSIESVMFKCHISGSEHLFISIPTVTTKKKRLLHAIKIVKQNRKEGWILLGYVIPFRGPKPSMKH